LDSNINPNTILPQDMDKSTKGQKRKNGEHHGTNGNVTIISDTKYWDQESSQSYFDDEVTEDILSRKSHEVYEKEKIFLERYRNADPNTRLQMMAAEGDEINLERSLLEHELRRFSRNEWLKNLRGNNDKNEIDQVFSEIAKSTNPKDLYYYAEYLLHNGDDKEKLESLYYFQTSADLGEKNAQVYLGKLYFKGEQVRQDFKIALRYFKLASNQSDDFSQNVIGICYNGGLGVDKNFEKASKYWKRASEKGNFNAHLNLIRFAEKQREWNLVKPLLFVAAVTVVFIVWKKY